MKEDNSISIGAAPRFAAPPRTAGGLSAAGPGDGPAPGPGGTRPARLLVKVGRSVLDDVGAHFPPSGRAYPLALSRLFGGRRFFTFHCGNAATPSHPTAVNLILASDTGDPDNQVILGDLDNKTLSIFGNHTGDAFEITRITAVHRRVGTASNRVLTAAFSLHLKPGPGVSCLSPAFYRQVAALPDSRAQTAANSQRIGHWDKYLEINENLARDDQATVRYSRHRLVSGRSLVFTLAEDGIGARHVGSSVQLVTSESIEDGQTAYQGPQLGTIRACDPSARELSVDLDADFHELWQDGRVALPPSARLFVSKIGDLVQIRRLRNGLKSLARGQAENRRLDTFIFNAAEARLPGSHGEAARLDDADLLQPNLNPEQRQAVEGVLGSPDLFLIQGPPGTGKTTVIAEICYQNAIRGLRTLIASQTNLAVDNALGKLVHHPRIRALRKGNEASVQEEGRLFIESQVVATWLARTAEAGGQKQASLAAAAADLDAARQMLPDIAWSYRAHARLSRLLAEGEPGIQDLQRQNEALDRQCRILGDAFDRFMEDPAGPAFNVLSAHADRLDTQTLVLIGQVNAAAVRYAQARRQAEAGAARFRELAGTLARLAHAARRRMQRIAQHPLRPFRRQERSGHAAALAETAAAAAGMAARMQESGFEFTLDDHILQAERARRELKRLNRTVPGFLLILFGRAAAWTGEAAECIALADWLCGRCERIVQAELAKVETIFDNPAVADGIRSLAGAFRTIRESLLMALNANLSEIDNRLEQAAQARQRLADARQRVEAFHASLPHVRLEPFELIAARLGDRFKDDRAAAVIDEGRGGAGEDRGGAESLEAAAAAIYEAAFAAARERLAAEQDLVRAWTDRIREPDADDQAALKQLYISQANVIGITCNQSGAYEFSRQYPAFDVAIIDEVSKATPPELILPILKARKIVLVGDHRQLPPMVGMETYEEIAQQLGIPEAETAHMQTGLFEELFTQAPQPLRRMLTTQYRMHPQIMETINQFYADGNGTGLRCGIDRPEERRRHGCHGRAVGSADHALWVDLPQTDSHRERRSETGFSYANPSEAAAIRQILLTLSANLKANDPGATKRVGVISFYSSQVRLLEAELLDPAFAARTPNLTLRIGSVDRFQGIECPIVICSFVRNNDRGDIGFARDPRRVNVALSRAQELSIIVGCSALFCGAGASASAIYGTIADRIREHGGFRHALDFG